MDNELIKTLEKLELNIKKLEFSSKTYEQIYEKTIENYKMIMNIKLN